MELLGTVKQIGIFMICAQAILHFKPAACYEKYLKLLISVMVLVQLITPLMGILSPETKEKFFERIQLIGSEMTGAMEQLEIENTINEENVLQQTRNEIKLRINNVATKYELSVSYIQFEHADLSGKMEVYVQKAKKMQDSDIYIDSVSIVLDITAGGTNQEQKTENTEAENEKLQLLCKEIALELGKPEEEIEVMWYE